MVGSFLSLPRYSSLMHCENRMNSILGYFITPIFVDHVAYYSFIAFICSYSSQLKLVDWVLMFWIILRSTFNAWKASASEPAQTFSAVCSSRICSYRDKFLPDAYFSTISIFIPMLERADTAPWISPKFLHC